MEGTCLRCLWVKHKLGYKYPFSIFPGVFSVIDGYSKVTTSTYFDAHGVLPPWLEVVFPGGKPVKCPHWSKFKMTADGLTFRGNADEILVNENDNTFAVFDYKTSRSKGTDDPFYPLYASQLTQYGMIGEDTGLGKLAKLALVYYEPSGTFGEEVGTRLGDLVSDTGILMRFTPTVVPVEVSPSSVMATVKLAKMVLSMPKAPEGVPGCRDCKAVDSMLALPM